MQRQDSMPLPPSRGPDVSFPGLGRQGESLRNTQGIGEALSAACPLAQYPETLVSAGENGWAAK